MFLMCRAAYLVDHPGAAMPHLSTPLLLCSSSPFYPCKTTSEKSHGYWLVMVPLMVRLGFVKAAGVSPLAWFTHCSSIRPPGPR